MGCLRGFHGFSTPTGFFTGFLRPITWFSNPAVKTAPKVSSRAPNFVELQLLKENCQQMFPLGKQMVLPFGWHRQMSVAGNVFHDLWDTSIFPRIVKSHRLVETKGTEAFRNGWKFLGTSVLLKLWEDPQKSQAKTIRIVPRWSCYGMVKMDHVSPNLMKFKRFELPPRASSPIRNVHPSP